jgi:hypothetical protein
MISSSHAHDRDGAKLQTLREMHRSDRDLAQRNLDLVAEFDARNTGLLDGVLRPAKLTGRSHEKRQSRAAGLSNPTQYVQSV